PLGETDAVLPRPKIDKPFGVRCDEFGKEYIYQPSDVLKYEMEVPASFAVHPLFRDSLEPDKTDKYESISSPQPTPKKRFVRTLEWVVGIACIILIVTEFSLANLPKLSADVSGSLRPNDLMGAMFNLSNKGLLPVYDLKAGCKVMRADTPIPTNRDFAEPTTVYFPESHAEILSPGHDLAVPCGRAIAIKQDNPETPEMHAEVFFVSPTDRNGFGGTNRKLSRWKRRKQKMECGRGKASRDDRQTHHYEYPRLFGRGRSPNRKMRIETVRSIKVSCAKAPLLSANFKNVVLSRSRN